MTDISRLENQAQEVRELLRGLYGARASVSPRNSRESVVEMCGYLVRVRVDRRETDEITTVDVSCRLAVGVSPGLVARALLEESQKCIHGQFGLGTSRAQGNDGRRDVYFHYTLPITGSVDKHALQEAVGAVASSAACDGESFAELGHGMCTRGRPLLDDIDEGVDRP